MTPIDKMKAETMTRRGPAKHNNHGPWWGPPKPLIEWTKIEWTEIELRGTINGDDKKVV